jgi:hypothetical protein
MDRRRADRSPHPSRFRGEPFRAGLGHDHPTKFGTSGGLSLSRHGRVGRRGVRRPPRVFAQPFGTLSSTLRASAPPWAPAACLVCKRETSQIQNFLSNTVILTDIFNFRKFLVVGNQLIPRGEKIIAKTKKNLVAEVICCH